MSLQQREEAIRKFKDEDSEINILINYEVLTTGFDATNIECVFIDGILKHADVSLDNMPEFVDRLRIPVRSPETMEEYVAMPKAKQDELKDK